jgi:hypothetical protein
MGTASGIVVATSIPPKLSRVDAGVAVGESYQRLCIESWLACGFSVFSVNHSEEIAVLASRYPEVQFVETDRDLSQLTGRRNPLLGDLLGVLATRMEDVAGIINSDVVLDPGADWETALKKLTMGHVVIAQRHETASLQNGPLLRYAYGYDCFFFKPAYAQRVAPKSPAFGMGVPWWDYWLPLALSLEGPGILACEDAPVVHLTHSTAWQPILWRKSGVTFVRFLLDNIKAPPAGLASVLMRLRDFAALEGTDVEAARKLDAHLEQLGQICLSYLRKNTVRLDETAMPQTSHRRAASPALKALFSGFHERIEGAQAPAVAEAAGIAGVPQ